MNFLKKKIELPPVKSNVIITFSPEHNVHESMYSDVNHVINKNPFLQLVFDNYSLLIKMNLIESIRIYEYEKEVKND